MAVRRRIPRWVTAGTIVLGFCVIYFLITCATSSDSISSWWNRTSDNSNEVGSVLRVSPDDLFSGDLKHLQPHLGLTAAGCVKLEAPNQIHRIVLETEVWENGQSRPGPTLFSYASYVRHSRSVNGGPSQTWNTYTRKPDSASFSLREVNDANGKRTFHFVGAVASGGSLESMSTDIQIQEVKGDALEIRSSYIKKLDGPSQVAAGEKINVWSYIKEFQKPPGQYQEVKTIEEAAKAAVWAFVVKIIWERSAETL
jgi:hypothetical protein